MGKHDKLRDRIISSTSYANIAFADLCAMLLHYGFTVRRKATSHAIFTRPHVHEIINLQPGDGGKAKPYQVRQVRDILQKYDIK